MKRARIYIDGLFCGILTEDPEGYHFKYARYDDKKIYKTACDLVRERNTR